MDATDSRASPPAARKWRPLSRTQRRVAGVLVEKAKTTPEQYPLTLNAITTACNQKNNRHPLMNLHADDVQVAVDELRELGAVIEIQGGGRVAKYKHTLYDWLGVDKVELAVMAELLLRGEQTVGELRGRAGRMEPIADLSALRPVLDALIAKGLVVELTPPGRGQMVAHSLFEPLEMVAVRERAGSAAAAETSAGGDHPAASTSRNVAATPLEELEALRQDVAELRQQVVELNARCGRLEQLLN